MGEIVIRLRANRQTGKKDLVVEYESAPDATPLEHERRHREIVDLLVRTGTVTRAEADDLVFEPQAAPPAVEGQSEGQVE